ncbi:MAG: restriction endonuclease subunit S [Acidimicrobiales bacterium]
MRTPRINAEDLGEIKAPHVELATQRAIADYLDTETARIDALIAKKHRMIELLEERWRGWLRRRLLAQDIPIVPLKRGWSVIDCKHRTPTYVDAGYPVVSPGDATPGRLDLSRAHRFVDSEEFHELVSGGRRPQRGDIIYSRNASIGIASYVDTDVEFCMGQDVCLITSRSQSQLYLMYVLNSLGVDQLEELKVGSTFSRVNVGQILELEVPFPTSDEQHQIAEHVDRKRNHVDQLTGRIDRQINLLIEHRQALITAAVTGELDVSKAA